MSAALPEISMSNTKKEMLDAYKEVVRRLKEKRQAGIKPQERVEEKQKEEAIEVADALSTEGITREIGNLKSEVGRVLVDLSDKMESEIDRYLKIRKALDAREAELKEIYDIEREVSSLAALMETQKERREQFAAEMDAKKTTLEEEIASTRQEWREEQKTHDEEIKAREEAEKKRRDREAEEYKYTFEREKKLAQEQSDYEKARMERELQLRREELEKDLTAREQALVEQESELSSLREQVTAFPAELAAAVEKVVAETTDRLTREAQANLALMQKEFDGEKNVLNSRIDALQQSVKELQQQNAKLASQIEKSYNQVQDIAVKAIEGSSDVKTFARIQSQITEQTRGKGEGN